MYKQRFDADIKQNWLQNTYLDHLRIETNNFAAKNLKFDRFVFLLSEPPLNPPFCSHVSSLMFLISWRWLLFSSHVYSLFVKII